MGSYPIIPRSCPDVIEKLHCALPAFYMGDFSVLGFRVADYDGAIRLLSEHSFPLLRTETGTDLVVESAREAQAAVELLRESGIDCDLTDVVEGIYQG